MEPSQFLLRSLSSNSERKLVLVITLTISEQLTKLISHLLSRLPSLHMIAYPLSLNTISAVHQLSQRQSDNQPITELPSARQPRNEIRTELPETYCITLK